MKAPGRLRGVSGHSGRAKRRRAGLARASAVAVVQPGMGSGLAKGLSLWLMPEGETAEWLAARIDRLAARHGTERFAPHLTLLSALELAERQALVAAGCAAAEIAPFTVTLDDIQGRDEHFRCLFVRAKRDGALQAAHATAARAFEREPDAGFLPHVSLVYGTLAPDEKQAIAHEVGEELRVRFEVRRFHLWRTEGPVTEWRELGVFALGGA
jgi:2'-5' RNA ligase